MKKALSLLLAAVLLFGCASALFSCNLPESYEAGEAVISIDINPSVKLSVNDKGVVIGAYGANEDGLLLLFSEGGIIGASVEDAVAKVAELAVKLGFISEENLTVSTIVAATNPDAQPELKDKVDKALKTKIKEGGYEIEINSEVLFSIEREYNKFMEKEDAKKKFPKLTVEDFRVAFECAEKLGVDVEELLKNYSREEIIEKACTTYSEHRDFANETYTKLVNEAKASFEAELEQRLTKKWFDEYMKKDKIKGVAYAALYEIYSVATAMSKTAELLSGYVGEQKHFALDDEEIGDVLAALGLDASDKEYILDSMGDATIASIENYANKVIKNGKIEVDKEDLSDAIDRLETSVGNKFHPYVNKHKGKIGEILKGFAKAITDLEKLNIDILDDTIALAEKIEELASDGELSTDDINVILDQVKANAEAIKESVISEFTKEEKEAIEKEIEEERKKAEEEMKKDKEDQEALKKAEEEAKRELEDKKAQKEQEKAEKDAEKENKKP